MTETIQNFDTPAPKRGFKAIYILWIVLATILVTAAATYWLVRTYIYAKDFVPVELSVTEQRTLNGKLKALGYDAGPVTYKESEKATKE